MATSSVICLCLVLCWIAPTVTFSTCETNSVHYTDPVDLGWFNITENGPFCKDIWVPQAPKDVLDDIRLFTPGNRKPQTIDFFNLQGTLRTVNFDATLPLAVLTHGFHGGPHWLETSKDKLLNTVITNVLLVRWTKGSSGGSLEIDYPQAASNTRMTGAIIAYVLKQLRLNHGIDMSKVTIVGHSLGAHVAGFAGERLPGLGKIIGLDPAGPLFLDNAPQTRLDRSDAQFVHCIHTNAGELGNNQALGHVDVFMNGGFFQPGCPLTSVTCSHSRSHELFEDSLMAQQHSECVPTVSFQCSDKEKWESGECIYSATSRCDQFGYFLNKDHGCGGVYYMATTSARTSGGVKYFGQEYAVAVEFDSDSYGDLLLRLEYADGTVTTHEETVLFDGYTTELKSFMGKPVSSFCTHEHPVAAHLYYKKHGLVETLKVKMFLVVDQQGRRFSSGSFAIEDEQELRVPLS